METNRRFSSSASRAAWRGRVDGDHLGLDHVLGPSPGQPGDGLEDLGVDHAGLCLGQPVGQHGDLAGLPRLDLERLHRRPVRRQPVPQLEHVAQQRLRRPGRGLQQHAQLHDPCPGDARACPRRRPWSLPEPPGAGPAARPGRAERGSSVGVVEVRPLRDPREPLSAGPAAPRRSRRPGRRRTTPRRPPPPAPSPYRTYIRF